MEALKSKILYRVTTNASKTLKAVHSSKTKQPTGISIRGDIVGPPNPISNIRPITFHIPHNETTLERSFRMKKEEVHTWHEEFWKHHNKRFMLERQKFIELSKEKKADIKHLSPDEISVFYKSFLDKYWITHMWYNLEWYKQNANLLALACKVEIERVKRKLFSH